MSFLPFSLSTFEYLLLIYYSLSILFLFFPSRHVLKSHKLKSALTFFTYYLYVRIVYTFYIDVFSTLSKFMIVLFSRVIDGYAELNSIHAINLM